MLKKINKYKRCHISTIVCKERAKVIQKVKKKNEKKRSAAYDLFYAYFHRESHISKHILDSYGSISAVKLQSGIESELSVHY